MSVLGIFTIKKLRSYRPKSEPRLWLRHLDGLWWGGGGSLVIYQRMGKIGEYLGPRKEPCFEMTLRNLGKPMVMETWKLDCICLELISENVWNLTKNIQFKNLTKCILHFSNAWKTFGDTIATLKDRSNCYWRILLSTYNGKYVC